MRQVIEQKTIQNEGFKKKSLFFLTPFILGMTLYTGGVAVISAINLIEILFK